MKIDWKDYLGKRVLLECYGWDKFIEATVLKVSNKGKVKFKYMNGNIDWTSPRDTDYISIEVLGECNE